MTYRVAVDQIHVRLGETDLVRSVLQNIAVILRTKIGSCPMYREFGLPQNYIGKPMTAARQMMHAEIRDAVEAFEPRCNIVGVEFVEGSTGQLIPCVEVEIKNE